jgi:pyridoxine 5-phosphate synthase
MLDARYSMLSLSMVKLGVNIDHVATLRQVRYVGQLDSPNCEPDPIVAASVCERAGAQGITVHLRADKRHIQERDLFRLRESVITSLNVELGNTPEILETVLQVVPDDVCLVPENREEVTTEGGLDAVALGKQLKRSIKRLQAAGIQVSLFIEPSGDQIRAAADLGAQAVELHTGAYADAIGDFIEPEVDRLEAAARLAQSVGLIVNAGHGINYRNVDRLLKIRHWNEFNIGHSIVSRALFTGLETAVLDMVKKLRQ